MLSCCYTENCSMIFFGQDYNPRYLVHMQNTWIYQQTSKMVSLINTFVSQDGSWLFRNKTISTMLWLIVACLLWMLKTFILHAVSSLLVCIISVQFCGVLFNLIGALQVFLIIPKSVEVVRFNFQDLMVMSGGLQYIL